jgi:hypothetical protein
MGFPAPHCKVDSIYNSASKKQIGHGISPVEYKLYGDLPMLRKLAEIAQWLDAHQLYASANMIDDVIVKTASTMFLEPDLDEDEAPESDIWRPEAFHQMPVVHAASPEFLEMLRAHNPRYYEQWIEQLRGKGLDEHGIAPEEHTLTNYLGGNPIRLPKGFSKMPISELAHFIYPEDVLARNEEETLKRYKALTRDQKNRAMFEGNYVSSTQPKDEPTPEDLMRMREPKTYAFDPYVLDLIKQDYAGKGTDPSTMKMPMFDPKILRQIVDPTDTSEEALKMRENLKDKPLGTQLGYAMRNLNPQQMFGLWRKLRETDPETNKKKPFYYPKLRS